MRQKIDNDRKIRASQRLKSHMVKYQEKFKMVEEQRN